MYLDGQGRAISPSMVSQYSPPSPPLPQAQFPDSMVPPFNGGQWYGNMGGAASTLPGMVFAPMLVPASSFDGEGQAGQAIMMPVSRMQRSRY